MPTLDSFAIKLLAGLGNKTFVLVVITGHKGPVTVVIHGAIEVKRSAVTIEGSGVLEKGDLLSCLL